MQLPIKKSALLILGALLSFPGLAEAHAFLDHAEPKVGSTVKAAPPKVTAYFTQALEPAFSTLHVLDSSGKAVDKNDAAVDSADKTMLTVSLPKLPAGTYKVEWKVTSEDTHRTHGSFSFTIDPNG